jgi:hypothetical protein
MTHHREKILDVVRVYTVYRVPSTTKTKRKVRPERKGRKGINSKETAAEGVYAGSRKRCAEHMTR